MNAQQLPHTDVGEMRRILAATDLGPVGDAAIRIAHARASVADGHLAVCHVLPEVHGDAEAAARRSAEVHDELSDMLHRTLGEAGDHVEIFVMVGDASAQIRDCAAAWNADLVVIGRPDNPGGILHRLFRPGVVDKVVRYLPCAVLVTRHSPGTCRIVVGTDFSDPAWPALRAAAAEQQRTGAAVIAVHCVPPNAMLPMGDPAAGVMPQPAWAELEEAMRQQLETAVAEAGVKAACKIVFDSAAAGIIETARELAADMVIVGTHGRSGLARLALGSVAQHVVNDAPCPVMVVRLRHPD